jgi:hypothetical protein
MASVKDFNIGDVVLIYRPQTLYHLKRAVVKGYQQRQGVDYVMIQIVGSEVVMPHPPNLLRHEADVREGLFEGDA